MTLRSLFAVGLALIAVWYLVSCLAMFVAMATGPFAYLIVGLIFLYIANRIYRGNGKAGE